ncbi:MAG: YggT family protein [Candidatus Moranbacteria bacterium]|nr:YggT family protein [Candidatus Moranbacteria bacterium]
MDAMSSGSTKPLYRGTQIVYYILGLVEVLLAFRLVLKLLGANAGAGFTSFIYSVTAPFAAPFVAVFKVSKAQGSVFEWTTILAMFVYWVVALGIIKLLVMGKTVSTPEAAVKLDRQDQ